jgi:hypothetical protein
LWAVDCAAADRHEEHTEYANTLRQVRDALWQDAVNKNSIEPQEEMRLAICCVEAFRLMTSEVFGLHVQREGKAGYFFLSQVSVKKPLAGALQKDNYFFAEFGSLRAFG